MIITIQQQKLKKKKKNGRKKKNKVYGVISFNYQIY